MRTSRALGATFVSAAMVLGGAATADAVDVGSRGAHTPHLSSAAEVTAVDPGVRDTDAPRVIRVGAAYQEIPITVITGAPMSDLVAYVPDRRDDYDVAFGYAEEPEPARPAVFKPVVELWAEDLDAWGAHTWQFAAWASAEDEDPSATGSRPVDIRAHSLLGFTASRSGSTVTVRGSARAYHSVEDRYVPWSGRPVSVQRWTGQSWVQVTGVSTDVRGNFTTRVGVPAGSQLRLVTADVATIWGAVSATGTV